MVSQAAKKNIKLATRIPELNLIEFNYKNIHLRKSKSRWLVPTLKCVSSPAISITNFVLSKIQ